MVPSLFFPIMDKIVASNFNGKNHVLPLHNNVKNLKFCSLPPNTIQKLKGGIRMDNFSGFVATNFV